MVLSQKLSQLAVAWFLFLRDNVVKLGPGVLAPDPPKQIKVVSPISFSFKGYTITPLAKFHIKAKVTTPLLSLCL